MIKILLAEDDLFLRDIYTEILLGEGYSVTTAVDGDQALRTLQEGEWDLVLLDVVMPKMSGIEVLRHIQSEKPQTLAKHIIFMTNTDDKKGMEDVLAMTDGYLLKSSFTPGELVAKIKLILK